MEIPDRLDALHYAIDHAQEGDLIAVIGKGHEAYRDREGVKTPFLERELIEEYAAETGGRISNFAGLCFAFCCFAAKAARPCFSLRKLWYTVCVC